MNQIPHRLRQSILADRRDRILDAAATLFCARGFAGTTLDDIAAAIGVTKPFIYVHFRGKTELLAACCAPAIRLSCEAMEDATAAPGSATDRLRQAITAFTKVVMDNHANIAVFFREEKHLLPEDLAEMNRLRKRFNQLLTALLEEGVRNGEFLLPDPRLAAMALGGMISWVYTLYHLDGRPDADTMSARMADMALRMVGAPGGR